MEENNENNIRMSFNKKFYSIDAVKEAMADFSEICGSKIIKDDNDKIIVELSSKQELDVPLKEEFSNYVLGLLKNKGLV